MSDTKDAADAPKIEHLLWPEHGRPKRGPKPRLSLEGIVGAAIAQADAEGLAGVSMQRIAERLGATKMSLYRYTPSKDELTALMLDTVLGAAPAAVTGPGDADPGAWRAALTTWSAAMYDAFSLHSWALDLAVGARVLGPNELGWLEAGMRALAGTAFSRAERMDILALLGGHVRAILQQRVATAPGSPEAGTQALTAAALAAHASQYPETAAAFAEAQHTGGQDNALAFGLARILDGVEAAMSRRPGPA